MTLFNNNKKTINDIGNIIDILPEELHILKKQFRDDNKKSDEKTKEMIESLKNEIKSTLNEYDFKKFKEKYKDEAEKNNE